MKTIRKKIGWPLTILIYGLFVIWFGRELMKEHHSSFEECMSIYNGDCEETILEQYVNYDISVEQATQNGYVLYKVNGWEAEKEKNAWKSTLEGIAIRNEAAIWKIDIWKTEWKEAVRVLGEKIEDNRLGFFAMIPTDQLLQGKYQIGLFLKNGEIAWTEVSFTVEGMGEK